MPTSYQIINNVVQNKITILKEEARFLTEQNATLLVHYTKRTIDKSMKRIIAENPDYEISYQCEINAVTLHIRPKTRNKEK
ncbi:hypothetical protein BKG94_08475 [Rodentibacter ratti]|uniref:hypothetical protein n=1 Tax=Rodentibacter ratti TaxID=1906745 RepID=UPI00098691DD|nr:hypothetical protein [Rodentibacter ratti]OOF88026.1 hypothetical protein BKG94_08475 [Rodentibacter ratti]